MRGVTFHASGFSFFVSFWRYTSFQFTSIRTRAVVWAPSITFLLLIGQAFNTCSTFAYRYVFSRCKRIIRRQVALFRFEDFIFKPQKQLWVRKPSDWWPVPVPIRSSVRVKIVFPSCFSRRSEKFDWVEVGKSRRAWIAIVRVHDTSIVTRKSVTAANPSQRSLTSDFFICFHKTFEKSCKLVYL